MERLSEGFGKIQEMGSSAINKASGAAKKLQENWSDIKKTVSEGLDNAVDNIGNKARLGDSFLWNYRSAIITEGGDIQQSGDEIKNTVASGLKSGVKILAFVPITAFKLVGLIPNMIRRGHEEFHPGEGITENTKAVLKGALLRGAVKPAAKVTEGLVKDMAKFGLFMSVGALGCYHNAKKALAEKFPNRFKEASVQFSENQIDTFNKAMKTKWTKEIGKRLSGE